MLPFFPPLSNFYRRLESQPRFCYFYGGVLLVTVQTARCQMVSFQWKFISVLVLPRPRVWHVWLWIFFDPIRYLLPILFLARNKPRTMDSNHVNSNPLTNCDDVYYGIYVPQEDSSWFEWKGLTNKWYYYIYTQGYFFYLWNYVARYAVNKQWHESSLIPI